MPFGRAKEYVSDRIQRRRAKKEAKKRAKRLRKDREKFKRPQEQLPQDPIDMDSSSEMAMDMGDDGGSLRGRVESGLEKAGEAADAVGELGEALDGGDKTFGGQQSGRRLTADEMNSLGGIGSGRRERVADPGRRQRDREPVEDVLVSGDR